MALTGARIWPGAVISLNVAIDTKMAVAKTAGAVGVATVTVGTVYAVMTLTEAKLFGNRRCVVTDGFKKRVLAVPKIDFCEGLNTEARFVAPPEFCGFFI
jgi:hypothetical protein